MKKNNTKLNNLKVLVEKNKKLLLMVLAILVIVVASVAAYIYSVNKAVVAWEDKVYPGVEVYGVSLGGATKEEGLKIIEEQLMPKINSKKIIIKVGDKVNEITYSDIAPNYDANSILDEAMSYGKNQSLFKKKSLISKEEKHEIKPDITYDEELLKVKEEEIRNKVDIKPVNAKLVINGSTPVVTEGTVGYMIDSEEFHKGIMESINGNPLENSELTFELKETKPSITAEELKKVNGKISSFTTSFRKGYDTGRDKNMEVALNYINGTVLMPGDVFSYYEKIGATTPEKGYELSNVYVADRIEKDYGGGVCQVSSTLYRAAMGANLRSVERRNHSMTVSYAEPGLDATYASGYIDYKFKNNYNFPVYIQGYISGNNVVVNVFGNVEGMEGKTYKMVNEIIETYQPKLVEKQDPSMYVGEKKVQQNGMVGYKAKGYLVTYQNGVEINKELISTDVYNTMNRVVLVGTKPRPQQEAPKPPAPTPAPTEEEAKPEL